jgi:hypothetical protein
MESVETPVLTKVILLRSSRHSVRPLPLLPQSGVVLMW